MKKNSETEEKKNNGSTETKKAPVKKIDLNAQIKAQQEKVNTLNRLFTHRDIFTNTNVKIEEFKSVVKQQLDEKDFEHPKCKVVFIENESYRDNEYFKIGNPDLLLEFLDWLKVKTSDKLEQINTSIVAMSN